MATYRPGLIELEAAMAVARRGSFRAAALDMGMSTTALSNTIAKLEANLQTRLFSRTTRSVSPTDAGRLFIDQVGPVLQDMRGAIESVVSHSAGPSGTLRINAFASAARELLSPLVLAFLQQHPQVEIDLVTEGRMVDIVAEGFDFGVRLASLVPSDMIAISLGMPQRYAVVGAPDYIAQHGRPATPAELLQHSCIRIRLPNGALFPWQFERNGNPIKVDVSGQLTLDEASLAKAAVKSGMGLGLLMEHDVANEIETGQLVRVLADWTPARGSLCLYYPNRRNPSAAFTAFITLARSMAS